MSVALESYADLPPHEATLLWAMRVWVVGHCRQQDMSDRIGSALRDVGAGWSVADLEGYMWALSRGARRPLEVLCLCRTEVSADERVLLDAVVFMEQDEAGEAHTLLSELISETAATIALRSVERIAQALSPQWTTSGRDATPARRVLH